VERSQEPREGPPWVGPADGVIPGVVALGLVLARTERLAVYLPELLVYPAGVALRLLLVGRGPLSPTIVTNPGTWRFGVQFSDGRKATSYGLGIAAPGASATAVDTTIGEPPAPAPILRSRGLSGGAARWQVGYWLSPLPPAGDATLACEWPDLDVDLATAPLAALRVHDAARRARDLWPPGS
jgi:hypothetical protein